MQAPQPPGDGSPAPRVRVELLGLPALVGVDGERIALERKSAALLAMLAIDGTRPRSELCALLWPQATPSQARNSLRQRLFRLQRAAGIDIVAGQEALRLADAVVHDLHGLAARLDADPAARVGPLLEGLDYDDTDALSQWVETARERLRRQRSERLAELASLHESEQRIAQALAYAERLVDDEPLLEHAHRRVMRLHYLRGDRSAALAAFERCRRRLHQDLATAPDRETRELAALIGSAEDLPARDSLARAAPPPLSVLRPPLISGREPQRAQLAQALAARATLLVHGEPGIGKTRLLEDAADTHRAVLLAGAQAGDSRVPYATLARVAKALHERYAAPLPDWARAELARLLPALGAAPTAWLDALRLQQAWNAAVSAWAAAGLQGVMVDDLHHADDASLECLLAISIAPPLAWVFSARTQELPEALTQWLAARAPGSVAQIALPLLGEADVAALLGSLSLHRFDAERWSAALMRHSGGNPLFALETVRALLALGDGAPPPDSARLPVPAALDALIERRFSRLSEKALRLVRVAALTGADFDADVAAQVLEAHPLDIVEPWRELEQAQLLREGRPAHDLIAEAASRALPASIAQALHGRIAASLETFGRSAARVAPHWAAAQAWPRAGAAYAQAAGDACRSSRRSDEILLWEHAATAFDRAGQTDRAFEARADSVRSVILVRGVGAAMPLVDRLDADQRTEPQRMRALTARATACLMAGQAAAGEHAARAALDAATRLGAKWSQFEAARLLAVALSQAARAAEALATIEPFQAFVMAQGTVEQRQQFWSDYAYCLKAAQRAGDTARALRQAMQAAQEAGDYAELATLNSNLALVEGNLGNIQHALDHARRARALSDPLGEAMGPATGAIEMYIAGHETALGRYREALGSFARAQACFEGDATTIWLGLAANHKANLLINLGQFTRARQTLQHDWPMLPATEGRREMLQARIDRALGHQGGHSAAAGFAMLGERADPIMSMLLRLEMSLALPPRKALEACTALRDEATACEHLAIAMRARVLRLEHLLATQSLTGDDVDGCTDALRSTHPADTYLPAAWWSIARAYRAVGRDDDADATLREAWTWIVERALPHVPDAYRDSFMARNPTNRDLLAAAAHRLSLTIPAS